MSARRDLTRGFDAWPNRSGFKMEAMEIKREYYLQKLVGRMHNGLVKIVTGIRRCGKSYLLFKLFKDYLLCHGVPEDHVIEAKLDLFPNKKLRNPQVFIDYVQSRLKDKGNYFVIVDEVQMMGEFESVLNYLVSLGNLDVYVSGSNSKFLSSDVITEFRGRGDEIRVHPLSFSEFMQVYDGDAAKGWLEYCTYGGLPFILSIKDPFDKVEYLRQLFDAVYLRDIKERRKIRDPGTLDSLADVLASCIGSLINPPRLERTFKSALGKDISVNTIENYLSSFEDAFLISKAKRYDIKGRKYIGTPYKYYFEDVGLRNVRINMSQFEQTHIMENILYNELRLRGYCVDVGNIQKRFRDGAGKMGARQLEVDFIASKGNRRAYVQSAFSIPDEEKMIQEKRPLMEIGDSFRKIIVTKDSTLPMYDEDGIMFVNLFDFLLNKEPSLL